MFYDNTVMEFTNLINQLQVLFKEYEQFTPEYTNNFTVEPKRLHFSSDHKVRITVKDLEEVPHLFVQKLGTIFNRLPISGDAYLVVEDLSQEVDYDSDYWGDMDEEWVIPVTVDEYWGGFNYTYTLTPEDKKRSNKETWPIYGQVTVKGGHSKVTYENHANNQPNHREMIQKRLGSYKEVLADLSILHQSIDEEPFVYKLPKEVNHTGLLSDLRHDIQAVKESLATQNEGKLGRLYGEQTHSCHQELMVYFNLGLKEAYISYNAVGYNFNWNVATPKNHKHLKHKTQYTLSDLSWKGYSHPGWQGSDLSGRAVRSLKDDTTTFSKLQTLLEEELEGIFSEPEWRRNYSSGSGVVFSLNALAVGDINTYVEGHNNIIFLNDDGQIVAIIEGYKTLNIPLAIQKIDTLRGQLGVL